MSRSYKCRYCEEAWPYESVYQTCPVCRERTRESVVAPLAPEIARTSKVHADFGWWLWEHDRL